MNGVTSLYSFICSILFPSNKMKKVNEELAAFFEDEDVDNLTASGAAVEGFLGYLDENQLRRM